MTKRPYEVERIKVNDLEVDPKVQRSFLDRRKIRRIVENYNAGALGVITVSKRNPVTYIVLDGAHRVEATRIVTEGAGEMECHVFENLTIEEEAEMFLDLNYSNQPTLLDKFRVRIVKGDPVAIAIDEQVRMYGWKIDAAPGTANLQCVGALERINRASEKYEAEPPLIQAVMLVVTRAWGHDRFGAQAVILEGLAALLVEYGSLIDLDSLAKRLKDYKGGPRGLHTDATSLAAMKQGKVSMAVAERLVDEYNKGRRGKHLHPWRRRVL